MKKETLEALKKSFTKKGDEMTKIIFLALLASIDFGLWKNNFLAGIWMYTIIMLGLAIIDFYKKKVRLVIK